MINGGAGNDTLRIVASNTTPQQVSPSLNSVENIEFQGFGSGTTNLNLAASTGVKSISLANGNNGNLNVSGVKSIVDIGASNTTGSKLQVSYDAAVVAGLSDVQKISLKNANSKIGVDGVEIINLAVEGVNESAIEGNAITTVNVSGAGSVVIANDFNTTTTTFNASANTGGVTASFTAGGNVVATGGTGNDKFIFGAGLTVEDVVNGGAGFDTVSVNGGDYSLATSATLKGLNALTAVERVEFTGAAGTTINGGTFTNAGVTNIQFNTTGADVIDNAGSARTYEFGAVNQDDATFNMNGLSTALNIDLLGTANVAPASGTNNTVEVGNLVVNLAGTQPAGTVVAISLTSAGNFAAGQANSVNNINAASGSTVTVDGNAALKIAGATNNITINASALTGNMDVKGSATVLAEVGSIAKATLLTQGFDNITLSQGSNVVHFNSNGLDSGIIQYVGADTAAVVNGKILHDVVTGFNAGAAAGFDVLDIDGVGATYTTLAAASQAAITALSGAGATLAAAANLATNGTTAAGWTAFSFQGATYALYEGTAGAANFANADTLVELVGVKVTDLVAANFA